MAVFEELRSKLRNVHVYAVTPFLANDLYSIDLAGFAENLEFLADRRVRVVCVAGGTGEFEALSELEILTVARIAFERLGGRALVIPSVPGNLGLAHQLLDCYADLGAEVVLAVPPLVRWKVPDELFGVVDYYGELARLSNVALIP